MLGNVEVTRVRAAKIADRCLLVRVRAPARDRHADRRHPRPGAVGQPSRPRRWCARLDDDEIVCRCERVTAGEIRALIRGGVRDLNELKAVDARRHGRVRRQDLPEPHQAPVPRGRRRRRARSPTSRARPLFMEVPLGAFAGVVADGGPPTDVALRHATDAHKGGL